MKVTIVGGCYEKVIFGYNFEGAPNAENLDNEESPKQEFVLNSSFVTASHQGCVKCIACTKHVLVSGSTDETIKVYDLKNKVEVCSLTSPTSKGHPTYFQFFTPKNSSLASHLFCGNDDGTIGIWTAHDWECLKTLKGHKGPITSISVHPSGKLALSTSRDCHMKMWNLTTGNIAMSINLHQQGDIICWSPTADHYAVVQSDKITTYEAKEGNRVHVMQSAAKKPILAIVYLQDSVIAASGEDKSITLWNTEDGTILKTLEDCHLNRIKALTTIPPSEAIQLQPDHVMLVSASSDGFIKVWNIYLPKKLSPAKISYQLVAEQSTTARITCIAATVYREAKKKRKREEVQDK